MDNLDPKWKQTIRDHINSMDENEFQSFLKRTKFDFYNNINVPVLSYLEALDEISPSEASMPIWLADTLLSPSWAVFNSITVSLWVPDTALDIQVKFEQEPVMVFCPDVEALFFESERIEYALAA